MSSRVLKALTFLYLVLVVGVLVIAVLFTRMQQSEKANRLFQTMVPVAEQFAQTYQTMDSGLRAKSSQVLFELLGAESGAMLVAIIDAKGETVLLWGTGPQVARTGNGSPAYSQPRADLRTEVFETSLPGAVRLVAAFNLLGIDDIERFAVVSLVLLGVWVFFLLVNLFVGKDQTSEEPQVTPPNVDDMVRRSPVVEPDSPIRTPVQTRQEPIIPVEEPEYPRETLNDNTTPKEDRDSRFVLIDRKTGVTQERFLRFRLDKELERNAENAMDLSVALFQFKGLIPADFSQAAGLLLSEYSHEDLIFEYGVDTFCVILPQHDLDQAIARAELVMRKADSQREDHFKGSFELTVGLSSRNGRLLDAQRFLKEAMVAVKKASREEGRIVGFRPDPVRFRNFLRHQRV
jgi:GGDEF domain-containing protein